MKKFLLGTTALISMTAASAAMAGGSHAPAVAAPANTGGLTVMVGGKLDFQSAFISQDENATNGTGGAASSNQLFRNDTRLNVTAAGSTENFDYGAVVELNTDTTNTKNNAAGNADKTYLFVENDNFGRFEGGANSGASDTLEVDAAKIARATGGVDGDWKYNVNTAATGTGTATTTAAGAAGISGAGGAGVGYLLAPNLPMSEQDKNGPDSNKITYYTPRMGGVQLGVSYTPDSGNTGTAAGITTSNTPGNTIGAPAQYQNVFAGGINYEADFEGVGVMASLVGEHGDAANTAPVALTSRNDLSAYSAGLGVEFSGFSIAGSYGDLGDSGYLTSTTVNKDQTFWDIGAAYENGPYGVSVTYFDSSKGTGAAAVNNGGSNDLTNLVVGADYQMAPGLTPYVEASFFDFKNDTATADNSGNVVLVGAELAF